MNDIKVLSLGYTRSLWDEREINDRSRMGAYAQLVQKYTVIAVALRRHGLDRRIFAPNFTGIPSNGRTTIENVFRIPLLAYRELKQERYSLIQAQDPAFLGLVAVLLGRWFGVPVNVCVYGANPFDRYWCRASWLTRLVALPARWVLRQCAGIQVDGRQTERSLVAERIAPEKIYRKPMVPVDLDEFFQLVPRTVDRGRPLRLLFVGRLARQKNLEGLLDALKIAGKNVSLTLAGAGPDEGKLRRRVERLGLAERVSFRGQVDRSGLLREFAAADALVLPSWYEGFPRVLLEAAAAGLPAIATAVSGADEMIEEGASGFIVPVGDTASVADRITRLADDASVRAGMGVAARAHALRVLATADKSDVQQHIWREVAARVGA